VAGSKDIENRDWATSYRGPLLIHAGKAIDHAAMARIRERHGIELPSHFQTGGIIGIVTLADIVSQSASPWFEGRFGWVLKDARPVAFVPLRGQLGLFTMPAMMGAR